MKLSPLPEHPRHGAPPAVAQGGLNIERQRTRKKLWNRRHPEAIRAAHRRFERTAKRKAYLTGRGREARRMNFRLRHEIRTGRFPKPGRCAFADTTCYGAVTYAHLGYDRWDNVISFCRSHHSRFDRALPKTKPSEGKRNVAA